jgi:hypothetical protein
MLPKVPPLASSTLAALHRRPEQEILRIEEFRPNYSLARAASARRSRACPDERFPRCYLLKTSPPSVANWRGASTNPNVGKMVRA